MCLIVTVLRLVGCVVVFVCFCLVVDIGLLIDACVLHVCCLVCCLLLVVLRLLFTV